ncbi:MltA-interacting MipA family protein [Azorhizobium oxalatiphilum]|uniref:MltA-interacting MipA family protein n=1 Tax=Azorhizobium oxalatiphilum TaxID=980631 RepID=A0A917FDK0_9HYPH|nr:MipA/OmpV family protein [Azorhizobium oxalatiphilum]GGF65092.1 MltA-interacting MipA family protein [Azorhizobium oxalatiphilum]
MPLPVSRSASPLRSRLPGDQRRILPLTAVATLLLISGRASAADLAASTSATTASRPAASASGTDFGQFAFVTDKLAEWKVVLGGGAMIAPKYEGSDEYEVSPVPFVSASFGDLVKLDPRGLSVNLYKADGFTFSGRLGYDGGRQQDDSDHLRGLGDIDAGAVVGAKVAYAIGQVELYAALNRTIGGSDGLEAKFGVDASFRYERMLFTAGMSGTWSDDNYMQAYFGVTPTQSALSGLPVYTIGAGLKRVDFNVSATYMLTDHWLIRGQAGLGYLIGDAADSPIVESKTQPSGILAIGYKF